MLSAFHVSSLYGSCTECKIVQRGFFYLHSCDGLCNLSILNPIHHGCYWTICCSVLLGPWWLLQLPHFWAISKHQGWLGGEKHPWHIDQIPLGKAQVLCLYQWIEEWGGWGGGLAVALDMGVDLMLLYVLWRGLVHGRRISWGKHWSNRDIIPGRTTVQVKIKFYLGLDSLESAPEKKTFN